jgi:quercetin dioxygenase-like cupin family protein
MLLSLMPCIKVFYVIEGAITVRIHSSTKVLTTGGMFIVPRGIISLTSHLTFV